MLTDKYYDKKVLMSIMLNLWKPMVTVFSENVGHGVVVVTFTDKENKGKECCHSC